MITISNDDKDTQQNILYGLLEKIIFDESTFSILKKAINDVSLGNIEPRKLRKLIIDGRVSMLESLLDMFPFYLKHLGIQQGVSDFSNQCNPEIEDKLKEQLKERDELLSQLGNRLNNIYENLDAPEKKYDLGNMTGLMNIRNTAIEGIINEADEAFIENDIREFIRLKDLLIARMIKLTYLKLYITESEFQDDLSENEMIKALRKKTKNQICNLKDLGYWNRMKKDSSKKDFELSSEKAEEGRKFYNETFTELDKIFKGE